MKTLYDHEADSDWAQFASLLEEAQTDDELENALGFIRALKLDAERAARRVIETIRNLDAEQEALGREIARLGEKKGRKKAQEDRLREFAAEYLSANQLKSIKTPIGTLCQMNGRPRLVVDLTAIDQWTPEARKAAEYSGALCSKWEVNKDALKTIDGFEKLPGVEIVAGRGGIQIR